MDDIVSEVIRHSVSDARHVCIVGEAYSVTNVINVDDGDVYIRRRVRRGECVRVYHLEQSTSTLNYNNDVTTQSPFAQLATFHTCMIAVRTLIAGLPQSVPKSLTVEVNGVTLAKFNSARQAVSTMEDIC